MNDKYNVSKFFDTFRAKIWIVVKTRAKNLPMYSRFGRKFWRFYYSFEVLLFVRILKKCKYVLLKY